MMGSSVFSDSIDRRYMLRRTLFPWKPRETIDEAVEFATEYGIDEIVWKIDTEEFSHGLPTLDQIRKYVPWLEEAHGKLSKAGVAMSINPWVTVGMRDAGWDLRETFPDFDWLTDIDGTQTKSQACPLNPAFREWLASAYEIYAGTRPRVLWIEDDIRAQNHRPARFTCFCNRHLEEFGKVTGRFWEREELREEILRAGEPSPVRILWMDFAGDGIARLIELICQRSQDRSPETQMGLMCSLPAMHATEHRDWDRVMTTVAGRFPFVVIRPCMGNYSEVSPQGLYGSRQRVSATLKCVRMPVHSCTEIENWPFTRFSKSVHFTRAQILLSAATRNQSMTFNAYDHLGTPLGEEPQYLQMMREVRPMVDALVDACPISATELGFGMLHPEDGPRFTRLVEGAEFGDISMGEEPWATALQSLGLSVTWSESPVVAVTGKKLLAYSESLDDLFSRGVLLDLSALEALDRLGRSKELAGAIPTGSFRRIERETPAEKPVDPAFGGDRECYMSVDHIPLRVRVGEVVPTDGARVISRFVNADRHPVLPAAVTFENALGGRVAVLPYDLSDGIRPWFLNWHRQRQIFGIARWLFRESVPLTVENVAYPLPIITENASLRVVSVFNLSQDTWPRIEMIMAAREEPVKVARLRADGSWKGLPSGDVRFAASRLAIEDDGQLPPLEMAAYKVVFPKR